MPISAPDGRLSLVVFDCDGTLVDSQHAILACMRDAFTTHGCAAPEDERIRQVIGLSLDEAVPRPAGDPGAARAWQPIRHTADRRFKPW